MADLGAVLEQLQAERAKLDKAGRIGMLSALRAKPPRSGKERTNSHSHLKYFFPPSSFGSGRLFALSESCKFDYVQSLFGSTDLSNGDNLRTVRPWEFDGEASTHEFPTGYNTIR